MYANTGIATDSARVNRSARWARLMAIPCRRLFAGRPMPDLRIDRPHVESSAGTLRWSIRIFIALPSVLQLLLCHDCQVVELCDRVSLGPHTDLARLGEGGVLDLVQFGAVEVDLE